MLCVKMTIKATIAFIIFSACINFAAVDATSMSTSDVNIVNTQQEQEQANNKEHSVPTFSISDLRRLSYSKSRLSNSDNDISSHSRSDEFREVLSTTGLLAVRLDDNDENGRHDDDDNNNSASDLEWYYSRDRRMALDGLCTCIDHPEFLELEQTHELTLPSNSGSRTQTQRTSVATATVGLDHPLPLPKGLDETCGSEVVHAMEGLRDVIATVSKVFISALDETILTSSMSSTSTSTTLLRDEQRGKSYKSITDIVSAANHLEHFHVYTNKKKENEEEEVGEHGEKVQKDNNDVAWDWHTDAGLFLVFVPAWDCNNRNDYNNNDNDNDETNNIDESFYYRDGHDGTPIRAKFDGGRTAIIMLGQGAQDWLNLPKSKSPLSKKLKQKHPFLKATSHSVRWADDTNFMSSPSSSLMQHEQQSQPQFQPQPQRRAWYGMMHLVPETALVYGAKTLREVKQTLSLSHQKKNDYQPSSPSAVAAIATAAQSNSISLGCGNIVPSSSSLLVSHKKDNDEDYFEVGQQRLPNSNSYISRRRHLETQDPSMCNNVTNFFCWMTCMDIPKVSEAELYIDAGYSLYCVDESVMDQTGGNVSAAYKPCVNQHNMACAGEWGKTVDGVPAANIDLSKNSSDVVYPFCYGGTSMYMEGFQWVQSSTCVILLFPSWVLNTAWKYAFAVIGTFLFAIGLEKFIQQRRKVMVYMSESTKYRLLVSAAFYGVQISIGYLLMLIIMIYSGVLFLAVILGLVTGHILFNAKDAIWPIYESPILDETEIGSDNNSHVVDSDNDDGDDDDNNNNADDDEYQSFTGNGCDGEETRKSCYRTSSIKSITVASEERALDEGSTHCQEFDNNEYYGSLDEENKGEGKVAPTNTHATAAAAIATAKKKKEHTNKNTKTKRKSDHGVPEGSTPCCQHGT